MSTDSNQPSSDAKRSEADLLKEEADRAREAIGKTIGDLKASLGRLADPHRLTHDHPFIAVGAAAVAGFAAAATMIPSRQQQAMRTLAAIEKALKQPAVEPSKTEEIKEAAAGGWIGIVLAEVMKLVRPLLTTLISSSLSGMNSTSNNGSNNGSNDGPNVGPNDGETNGEAPSSEQPAVSSPS